VIILGIDPGSRTTGYAFLEEQNNRIIVHNIGTIELKQFTTMGDKLNHLHKALSELIQCHGPDMAAVETQFFGVNAKSAFVVGQVRGIVLLNFSEAGIPYSEYAPATIKKVVTGNGQAKKDQLARMLSQLTGLKNLEKHLDASDALGVAFTHLQSIARSY